MRVEKDNELFFDHINLIFQVQVRVIFMHMKKEKFYMI